MPHWRARRRCGGWVPGFCRSADPVFAFVRKMQILILNAILRVVFPGHGGFSCPGSLNLHLTNQEKRAGDLSGCFADGFAGAGLATLRAGAADTGYGSASSLGPLALPCLGSPQGVMCPFAADKGARADVFFIATLYCSSYLVASIIFRVSGAGVEVAQETSEAGSEIRSATGAETERAISSIVAAFITDPSFRFCYPSPHQYLKATPLFVSAFCGQSFHHDCADAVSDFSGAALWLPPGVEPDAEELLRLTRETVPADRLEDVLGVFEEMGRWHPEEPVWYLAMIGVDPQARNRGLGSALMAHGLARVDEAGLPAYLESSNPRNIPLYERHGFEVLGEIRVGRAPVVTPMLRRPQ